MIKVTNLKKSFDDKLILKGINLEIEKGDVIAVLGPSGSGKTTLIKCLNFMHIADSGEMIFNEDVIDLHKLEKKKIYNIRKRTAFVFQNFNLFENKTVIENVTIGLTVARKIEKKKANEIAKTVLDKVGLAGKYDSYPSQLSGGQQQRVAIARAIAINPDIIYFDEPTSSLDPELIKEVLDVIKSLAKEGMTMMIVTHEMNFAKHVSNKVIFMEDGEIVEFCSSKKFFSNQSNERIQRFIKNLLDKGE